MLGISEAKYAKGYSLYLVFNNGKEGVVDLKRTIFNDHRAIFSELRDKSKFIDFKIGHDTVIWSNGLDLSPEYLLQLVAST